MPWGVGVRNRHHMLFSELQNTLSACPLEAKVVSTAKGIQGFVESASKNQTAQDALKWAQATLVLCLHFKCRVPPG